MHTWSAMRRKLETEYLAESLRGRLTYFVTCYHKTHDGDEGRAAIRLDGCEILKSNYYERYGAMWQAYEMRKTEPGADLSAAWQQAAYDALHDGTFCQADFYRAFREFDSQSIAESLQSENALVRMFALLDRRTGKRTLLRLKPQMEQAPDWLQMIYLLRLSAEHIQIATGEQE